MSLSFCSDFSFSQMMLALLEHSPDLYLDEIQEQLLAQHDVDISLSTVCRTLRRLGISSKKVTEFSPTLSVLCSSDI
jgi:transposase